MGVLDVAQRLRALAADPEHRRGIVAEQGMLPTLTVFLENGDAAVRATTLEVLESLAMEPANRAAMAAEPGLLDSLHALAHTAAPSVDARRAAAIAANVAAPPPAAPRTPVVERVNVQPLLGKAACADQPTRSYTFFVKGLHGEAQRDAVEAKLLNVVGVVSFWFDVYQQKAEVRARIEPSVIIDAIAAAGFTAVEWQGEGSPHAASKKTDGAGAAAESKADEAAYLEENENPQHSYGSGGWLGTLAIFGTPAAKKKKSKKNKNDGVLGTLSSWW